MKLDDMVSALKELKGWKGLPYCIEEPMGVEGLGVVTEDLLENLIMLIEFVKDLPYDLEQYDCDNNLFDKAMNQGVSGAIKHIEDFISNLETSGIDIKEKND